MKFCSKCGTELTNGVCKNCSKGGVNKKGVIIIGSIVLLAVGFIAFNKYQEKKIIEKKALGIECIKNKNYKEAYSNLDEYLKKKEGDFEVIKIQKDLVKIVEAENYIDEKNFDNARDELRNLNGKLETLEGKEAREELREKLKIKEIEEEERLKALVEEKREFLLGYWLIDSGIWQFKSKEKMQFIHNLHPNGLGLGGITDNMEYDEKSNVVKITEEYDEDESSGHEIGRLVEIKIKNDDSIGIEINKSGEELKAKRISQKDAVAYMYGYNLGERFEEDTGIFENDHFEEQAEKDKSYTGDMAIEFLAKKENNNKENYVAIEKDILPGYTSYEVKNKNTNKTEYVFEGNLTRADFREKYRKYANENKIELR